MQVFSRTSVRLNVPALKVGRFGSAYATTSLRSPARLGIQTQSLALSRSTSNLRHMGGGPNFPALPFSTAANMHRAPAAMVAKPVDVEIRTPRDPNTLSNYHNYVTRHTSVDFEIDFERKRLVGSVVLRLESLVDADEKVDVVLDSRYTSALHQSESTSKLMSREASSIFQKSKSIVKAQSSTAELGLNRMAARSPSPFPQLCLRARLLRSRLL